MMRVFAVLASASTVAAHASYMLEDSRCSRDLTVGASIMGEPAVAGSGTIVMMESSPPQVALQGGFGDVVFETTAGAFEGRSIGCGGSRAVASAGSSVTFQPPVTDQLYTIRALYASAHGQVSVAAEMVVGLPGGSSCPEDLDGDGNVNVNDLLNLLSGFGGTDPGTDVNGDGLVDVNDLLQLLSAFGTTNCASGGGGAGGAAAPCGYGEDCGGQQFTECGTMCPPTCGVGEMMICNMMCYNGFQCRDSMWDENANGVGSGACVALADCSVPMPELPPGMVDGRPFLSTKELPMYSLAIEQAVSDWVGMVGPDGKHNHDGRAGGDYGQEEEF